LEKKILGNLLNLARSDEEILKHKSFRDNYLIFFFIMYGKTGSCGGCALDDKQRGFIVRGNTNATYSSVYSLNVLNGLTSSPNALVSYRRLDVTHWTSVFKRYVSISSSMSFNFLSDLSAFFNNNNYKVNREK